MPVLHTLKSIGFQSVPRWYKETISMTALRALRPLGSFHRMIETAATSSSDSSSSDSASSADSDAASDSAVPDRRMQRLLVPGLVSESSTHQASNVRTLANGHVGALNGQESTQKKRDDGLIMDLETSLESQLFVPNNSRELPAFRQGRFIPANEIAPSCTNSKAPSAVLDPYAAPTLCPSPLLLGSSTTSVVKPSAVPTRSSSAVPIMAPIAVPRSMQAVGPRQAAQASTIQSVAHNCRMASRNHNFDLNAKTVEKRDNAAELDTGKSGFVRTIAQQKGSQIQKGKGSMQIVAHVKKDN
jgi:hypothetical protein